CTDSVRVYQKCRSIEGRTSPDHDWNEPEILAQAAEGRRKTPQGRIGVSAVQTLFIVHADQLSARTAENSPRLLAFQHVQLDLWRPLAGQSTPALRKTVSTPAGISDPSPAFRVALHLRRDSLNSMASRASDINDGKPGRGCY